jgi:transposase
MNLSPEALAIIEALKAENALLRKQLAQQEQRIAELERRLGLNSSNSGKPPSSDGLGKKPRIPGSLRSQSGKKSGGQEGHKGGTLRQVNNPDIIKQHTASCCAHCAAKLTAAMQSGIEKRQVFDMPEPRLEVTEHQADVYVCRHCGGTTKAAFPEGVTTAAQYGPRIKAAAIYLNAQQLIPEDRAAEILSLIHISEPTRRS